MVINFLFNYIIIPASLTSCVSHPSFVSFVVFFLSSRRGMMSGSQFSILGMSISNLEIAFPRRTWIRTICTSRTCRFCSMVDLECPTYMGPRWLQISCWWQIWKICHCVCSGGQTSQPHRCPTPSPVRASWKSWLRSRRLLMFCQQLCSEFKPTMVYNCSLTL